ncbi:MAG: helix-turn-helix transcriptional regulator [Ruminococcaceae bacterium]|nr:helix-turn-helix transcriptional regulator [Oscillospiraceae bacterium]
MKIYDYDGKKNICGKRVKEARKRLKLSQADLAARLQVNGIVIERDSVSRIEIGTRFVADYEIVAIAKCLQVTTSWLLDTEQE